MSMHVNSCIGEKRFVFLTFFWFFFISQERTSARTLRYYRRAANSCINETFSVHTFFSSQVYERKDVAAGGLQLPAAGGGSAAAAAVAGAAA